MSLARSNERFELALRVRSFGFPVALYVIGSSTGSNLIVGNSWRKFGRAARPRTAGCLSEMLRMLTAADAVCRRALHALFRLGMHQMSPFAAALHGSVRGTQA